MGKIKYNENLMVEFITKLSYSLAADIQIGSYINDSVDSIPAEIKNKVDYLCTKVLSDFGEYYDFESLFYNRILWSHNLIKSNDDYLGKLFDRLNENIDTVFHSNDFDVNTVYDKFDNFFSALSCEEREKILNYAYKFMSKLHKKIKKDNEFLDGYLSFTFKTDEEFNNFLSLFKISVNSKTLLSLDPNYLEKVYSYIGDDGSTIWNINVEFYNSIVDGSIFEKASTDYGYKLSDEQKNAILSYFKDQSEEIEKQIIYYDATKIVQESTYNVAKTIFLQKKQLPLDNYKYVFDKFGNQVKDENGKWKIRDEYFELLEKLKKEGGQSLLRNIEYFGVDDEYGQILCSEMTENEIVTLCLFDNMSRSDKLMCGGGNPSIGLFDYMDGLVYKYCDKLAHRLALRHVDGLSLGNNIEVVGEALNQFAVGFGDGLKDWLSNFGGWLQSEDTYFYEEPQDVANKEMWNILTSISHDPTGELDSTKYSLYLNDVAFANGEIDEYEYTVMKKIYSLGEDKLNAYKNILVESKDIGKTLGGNAPNILLKLVLPSNFMLGLSAFSAGGKKFKSEIKSGSTVMESLYDGVATSGISAATSTAFFKVGSAIYDSYYVDMNSLEFCEAFESIKTTEAAEAFFRKTDFINKSVTLLKPFLNKISSQAANDYISVNLGINDEPSNYWKTTCKEAEKQLEKLGFERLIDILEGLETMRVIK